MSISLQVIETVCRLNYVRKGLCRRWTHVDTWAVTIWNALIAFALYRILFFQKIHYFPMANSIHPYMYRCSAFYGIFWVIYLPFSRSEHLIKSKIILDYFEDKSSCYTTDFGKEQKHGVDITLTGCVSTYNRAYNKWPAKSNFDIEIPGGAYGIQRIYNISLREKKKYIKLRICTEFTFSFCTKN